MYVCTYKCTYSQSASIYNEWLSTYMYSIYFYL